MTFEIFGVVSTKKRVGEIGNSVVGMILMRLTDPLCREGMHHSHRHRSIIELNRLMILEQKGLLLNFQGL